ncbi:hypothetical protein ACFY4R_27620, partial [Streptomyces diastaticus]
MTYTSRDGTAWPLDYEEFIREHLAEFMRLGVQRLRSIHDADDAVANACKRIFERWEKIKYHPNPVAVSLFHPHSELVRCRVRMAWTRLVIRVVEHRS